MNRYESTKKVSLFGIVGNIFLLVIKFIVAFFSHSEAMMADAVNSAGDIFSSIMSFIGNKIAQIPKDNDHNFGHGKAEYIFSLIISLFMILVGAKILFSSIMSIINSATFVFSYYLILVCLLTILTKLFLYLYAKKMYKLFNNILIKASMKDHKNDMFLSLGTLISVIFGYFGYFFFDGIFGSITSIYIIVTGVGIFLESYKVLMDVALNPSIKNEIIKYVLEDNSVINIKDFYTIAIGYKYVVIISIELDGNLTTFASHQIADNLEKNILKNFKKIYKVIIHVNPVEILNC